MNTQGARGLSLNAETWENTVNAVLTSVLGVLLVVLPDDGAIQRCLFAGIAFIAMGLVSVCSFFRRGMESGEVPLALGATMMSIGSLCAIRPSAVSAFLPELLGIFIVLGAGASLANGVLGAKLFRSDGVLLSVLSVLVIFIGLFVMLAPPALAIPFVGWAVVLDGLFRLFVALNLGHLTAERAAFARDPGRPSDHEEKH